MILALAIYFGFNEFFDIRDGLIYYCTGDKKNEHV
jgi:hypothetical protein